MARAWTARLRFALFIVLPAVIAIAVVASAMKSIIDGMAASANLVSGEQGRKAVLAVLGSLREEAERYAEDNARWDAAAVHAYGEIDVKWFESTWGAATKGNIYDFVFLVDGEGRPLAGFSDGAPAAADARAMLGPEIATLLKPLPKDGRTFDVESGFFKGARGLAVAAAAPVLPISEGRTIPQAAPNYLIFGRRLDGEAIAELGKRFILDGLALAESGAAAPDAVDITDPSGRIVAQLAWAGARPGDVARQQVSGTAVLAFGVLLGVLTIFAFLFWRNLNRIQDDERRAIHWSLHDELSGLPNRRQLVGILREALTRPDRPGNDLALIYADLDRFKEVNDNYGHEIGDQLIKAVAAGFAQLTGNDGSLARLGGDEFAIVVTHPNASMRACEVGEMMIGLLTTPFDFDGRVISVGTSIGLVIPAPGETDPEEILRRADVAMYRAKAGGRNRLCVYEPVMDFERRQRQLMASDLRAAIDARELEVFYQPYIDSGSRRIAGVEALLRWNRKGFESVSPAVFIPVAEESGLIDDVGRYVLDIACRQARQWRHIRMSVNVSPAQFRNPGFVNSVQREIVSSGIDPRQLDIEVTESYLIDEPERAQLVIEGLHRLGVSVSIDDFGTGYSSIGYLRKFAFDKLKIDRSLVIGILTDPGAQRIVQGTVLIANALNLRVTAEGVENEDEATLLRLAGCSEFQGFLFHLPMTADRITALLKVQQPAPRLGRTAA